MPSESSYDYRRANIQAAFVLPYLQPDSHVLDVGAGPGSITRDFADLCPDGRVVGVDVSPEMVETATRATLAASSGSDGSAPGNLSFETCDAEDLSRFPDGSFDVVHAHTCLSHVRHPVAALREFNRVCRPGGVVAVRDPLDIERQVVWRPDLPAMRVQGRLAAAFLRARGAHPEAGTHLAAWAREAGLAGGGGRITVRTGDERQTKMLNFVGHGIGREEALRRGLVTGAELDGLNEAYQEWESAEDHVCIGKVAEMLCFKGESSVERAKGERI